MSSYQRIPKPVVLRDSLEADYRLNPQRGGGYELARRARSGVRTRSTAPAPGCGGPPLLGVLRKEGRVHSVLLGAAHSRRRYLLTRSQLSKKTFPRLSVGRHPVARASRRGAVCPEKAPSAKHAGPPPRGRSPALPAERPGLPGSRRTRGRRA